MMTASLVVELRLESTRTSVVATGGPHSTGSVVVAHRLSCSVACGIFLDWGLNQCPSVGRQILNHWITREVLHGSVNRYIFINAVAMTSQNCWAFMS